MNNIIELLNIKDPDVIFKEYQNENGIKSITVEKICSMHYCPMCNARMYSKGIKERVINHPMLQDGFKLHIILKQRRWKCTNPACQYTFNDNFNFIEPRKRNTNMTDFLILDAFRDINTTAAQIGRKFHVSDTHALKVFDKYVDMNRLKLGTALSIDEVHMEIPGECDYALILLDFTTREPIDIVASRRKEVTEPYFASIPREERAIVKYLICDMYNPYIAFVNKYFPNAVAVVDSFHVIQHLETKIMNYLNAMQKRFRMRDEEIKKSKEKESGRSLYLPQSDESYLLKHHKWIMLTNVDNINYNAKATFDRHFRYYMDTYTYEEQFFKIDSSFRDIRDLKEKYIAFNNMTGDISEIGSVLDTLINQYASSECYIFKDFSKLLKKYRTAILYSFTIVDTVKGSVRLSNGPIESFNRNPKDMKRTARGYGNFVHARNRLLFSLRDNAPILAIPRKENDFQKKTEIKRGPYKKCEK